MKLNDLLSHGIVNETRLVKGRSGAGYIYLGHVSVDSDDYIIVKEPYGVLQLELVDSLNFRDLFKVLFYNRELKQMYLSTKSYHDVSHFLYNVSISPNNFVLIDLLMESDANRYLNSDCIAKLNE